MISFKFLKTAGVTAIIAFIVINAVKTSWDIYKKGDRLTKLEAEVAGLQTKKADLEKEAVQVDTPEFIEQEARDELHMVKPGERIVILPAEPGTLDNLGVLGSSSQPVSQIPIWKQWLSLIFS